MGRPAASSVVWTGAHSLNHPSSFCQGGRTGKMKLEGYLKDISGYPTDN